MYQKFGPEKPQHATGGSHACILTRSLCCKTDDNPGAKLSVEFWGAKHNWTVATFALRKLWLLPKSTNRRKHMNFA